MGEVERSLDELAAAINSEHRKVEAAANTALAHALRAGELLLRAKEGVPHGSWVAWLAENFAGSDRTARAYMQVAQRRDELEAKRQTSAISSLAGALQALSTPRREEAPHQPERENRAIEEAQTRGHQTRGHLHEDGPRVHEDGQRVEDEPRPSASVFSRRSEEGPELLDVPRREAEWSEDECELLDAIREWEIIVVNMRVGGPHANLTRWIRERGLLYRVDRPGLWGNPFELPGDGDPETVVESYRIYYFRRKYFCTGVSPSSKARPWGAGACPSMRATPSF